MRGCATNWRRRCHRSARFRVYWGKKVNVLNHLAYLVDDLPANAARLLAMEFVQIAKARPAIAYGGRLIQFFVAPNRLMIELVEAADRQHRYDTAASMRTS